MIRALVVDDEAPARSELAYQLGQCQDVQVVGEADDGLQALSLAEQLHPDVLFLDVHMPEMDGMEVVRRLLSWKTIPYVVFVTAYDRYAVRAFELHALDYIQKPVDLERLSTCVNKVRNIVTKDLLFRGALEKLAGAMGSIPQNAPKEYAFQLAVRNGRRIYAVPVEDIRYVRIEGGVVEVGTPEGKRLSNFNTLEEVEDVLDPKWFFRVHRSYLVNIRSIREIVPLSNQTFNLRIKDCDDFEIPLSRIQAKKLRQMLKF